jgi:hypothetical protein
MRLDADEMILLALLEEGDTLSHQRIGDDDPGLRFMVIPAASKAATAASRSLPSALHEPAKASVSRPELERRHLRRGTVGLLVVDINDRDQVVGLKWAWT